MRRTFGRGGLDGIPANHDARERRAGSALFTGVLLGVGIIGFADEALLHQILQWHTFYWGTDQHARILSDGLFHVGSTALLIWGTARLWRDRASWSPHRRTLILGGLLLGGGAFNLYDGVVQHAILHFHLVNEHVCPVVNADNSLATCPADVPYEVVFDALAMLVLAAAAVVLARARSTSRRSA